MAERDKIDAAADQLAADIQKYFDACLADIDPKLREGFEAIIEKNADRSLQEASMLCLLVGYTPDQTASYFLGVLKMLQNIYGAKETRAPGAFEKLAQFTSQFSGPRGNA